MTIPSTRANENGRIIIDLEACCGCGLCVSGCSDGSLLLQNGKAAVSDRPIFGCFACGQCMAVCPNDAIAVSGRGLSPADVLPLPARESGADHTQLLALMLRRRSVRQFTDAPVSEEHIAKIVEAAQTAPMGIPPSEVRLLILAGREKVRRFSDDTYAIMKQNAWLTSSWALALLRPFLGKERHATFRHFIKPLVDAYREQREKGIDAVLYDAPLAIYFYGSPYSDSDQMIAATYAMLAGESLGLGTCMIGAVHPFLQIGEAGARVRKKYGITYKSRDGLVVIFGHAESSYRKSIHRTFAQVHGAE